MRWRRLTAALGLCLLSANYALRADALGSGSTSASCQICQTKKDCAQAFFGDPGEFCGYRINSTHDIVSCCCERKDLCRTDRPDCWCNSANDAKIGIGIGIAVASLFVGSFCAGCIKGCWDVRKANKKEQAKVREATKTGGAGASLPVTPVVAAPVAPVARAAPLTQAAPAAARAAPVTQTTTPAARSALVSPPYKPKSAGKKSNSNEDAKQFKKALKVFEKFLDGVKDANAEDNAGGDHGGMQEYNYNTGGDAGGHTGNGNTGNTGGDAGNTNSADIGWTVVAPPAETPAVSWAPVPVPVPGSYNESNYNSTAGGYPSGGFDGSGFNGGGGDY